MQAELRDVGRAVAAGTRDAGPRPQGRMLTVTYWRRRLRVRCPMQVVAPEKIRE
jgi:hypothetical protein